MSNKRRKVTIFTGNRAEYGLQYPIIKAISEHPGLDYYLLVSGAHLQEDFGYTMKEIEKDGFRVFSEVRLDMKQDTVFATAQAIGSGVVNIGRILNEIRPDLHFVYADRYEGFAATIAGTQMNIPTAHAEGGDLTEGGALDDSVRHAMTKLSHLHFTTNEQASERIRRLGEEPWRVHTVGYPTLDLIKEGKFASPEELRQKYGITVDKPIVIFTQHSVTTEYEKAAEQIRPSLEALKTLADEGCQVIATYPNNDAGGRAIITELERSKSQNIPGIQIHQNLGRYNYNGILNLCGKLGRGVCVGNSSSGIKETPAFGCPVVNVGSRQNGRLRSTNVLDVSYDKKEILAACHKALEDKAFRNSCAHCENPYGTGNAGRKVAEILASVEIGPGLLRKKMTY